MKTHPALHCPFVLTSLIVACGCGERPAAAKASPLVAGAQAPAPTVAPAAPVDPKVDAPVAEFRRDLLLLAFRAASALPLDPHTKSRGKAQEKVALACLDLALPATALEFGKHIADWRRGSVLADCAHYLAVRGAHDEARRQLQFADQIAQDVGNDVAAQEWRRDTILFKMARAFAALGDDLEARRVAAAIDPASGQAFDSGWAATAASRADLVTAETLDKELAALDLTIVSAASGQAFNAVAVCARLYDRFYGDPERREKIGARVRTRESKLPPDMHVSGLVELARIAARHGDSEHGKRLLYEAREYLRGSELGHEYRLGVVPLMAVVHAETGEIEAAKAELAEGVQRYHADRETYRGTKRAETLRPFAEAYLAIGDRAQAAEIYEQVLEEGVENPNSRPRAHDVSETCISMAKQGFEPDRKLLLRIREIVDGLGDPW